MIAKASRDSRSVTQLRITCDTSYRALDLIAAIVKCRKDPVSLMVREVLRLRRAQISHAEMFAGFDTAAKRKAWLREQGGAS